MAAQANTATASAEWQTEPLQLYTQAEAYGLHYPTGHDQVEYEQVGYGQVGYDQEAYTALSASAPLPPAKRQKTGDKNSSGIDLP